MTKTFTRAALAATVAATALLAVPASAQRNREAVPAGPAAPVVVVADTNGAMRVSNAFQVAMQQIQATYGPQLAQVEARTTALQAELQTLYTAYEAERTASPQNATRLRAAGAAFEGRQQAAEQEIQQLRAPIELAQAYVLEQISLRMAEAVDTARRARGATLVVDRESVLYFEESSSISSAIVTELNRLVPNVQIVPPQGYQPGALTTAARQAAAAAAAPAAGTPAPAPAQPETR